MDDLIYVMVVSEGSKFDRRVARVTGSDGGMDGIDIYGLDEGIEQSDSVSTYILWSELVQLSEIDYDVLLTAYREGNREPFIQFEEDLAAGYYQLMG